MLNPSAKVQRGLSGNAGFILLLLVFAIGVMCGAHFAPALDMDVSKLITDVKRKALEMVPASAWMDCFKAVGKGILLPGGVPASVPMTPLAALAAHFGGMINANVPASQSPSFDNSVNSDYADSVIDFSSDAAAMR